MPAETKEETMPYDAREYLVMHGVIDATPCRRCGGGKPPEFNSSADCPACMRVEFEEDGLPVEEFDRMRAEMSAHPTTPQGA